MQRKRKEDGGRIIPTANNMQVATLILASLALAVACLSLWRTRKPRHRTVKLRDGWEMTETVVDVKQGPQGTVLTSETTVSPSAMRKFPFQSEAKRMFRQAEKGVQK